MNMLDTVKTMVSSAVTYVTNVTKSIVADGTANHIGVIVVAAFFVGLVVGVMI